MSLINEALQRARDEAVRQESIKRGVPLPPPPSRPQRSNWLAITVLVLAAALAVSVVALLGLSRQLPEARTEPDWPIVPTAAPSAREAIGAPSSSEDPAAIASLPQEPQVDSVSTSRATTESTPGKSSAMSIQEPARETYPTESIRKSAAVESTEASPNDQNVPPASNRSNSTPESYLRHVDLQDAGSLDLGGIAWSEAGPYALLNGRVVGVGESVSGFLVREIDPLQVTLEGQGRRLVLRLK